MHLDIKKYTSSQELSKETHVDLQEFFRTHYPTWFPAFRHTMDHEYIRDLPARLAKDTTLLLAFDTHQRIQGLITTTLEEEPTMNILTLEWAMTGEKQRGIFKRLFAEVLSDARTIRTATLLQQKMFFLLTNVYKKNPAYQIFEHYGFFPSLCFNTKEGVILQKALMES